MAAKKKYYVVERNNGLLGMMAQDSLDYCIENNFIKSHTEGVFVKNKPGEFRREVKGVFTAVDGKKYVVYVDYSANHYENVDEKGYPKSS